MRIRLIAAVLAVALLSHAGAHAAGDAAEGQPGFSLSDFTLTTAQDLYDVCTVAASDPRHAVAEAFCYGFFSGGKHYHDEVATVALIGPVVCPDRLPSREEVVAVFVDFMQRNPQHAADRPMNAVFEAIGERWPCPPSP